MKGGWVQVDGRRWLGAGGWTQVAGRRWLGEDWYYASNIYSSRLWEALSVSSFSLHNFNVALSQKHLKNHR